MARAFVIADNIVTPLGLTTAANFRALKNGLSGITLQEASDFSPLSFYASIFKKDEFKTNDNYTKFEQLLIKSISDAIDQSTINPASDKTGIIISSTKGNIGLLETCKPTAALYNRIALHTSATLIAEHFGFKNKPVVISNACISGVLAIVTAMRMIRSGRYETVIVSGADVISRFILSGFQSFNAVSALPCKPFDNERDGVTLGEGAATIVVSSKPVSSTAVEVLGGASSNDANHISAPSRTGEELGQAIIASVKEADITAQQIDMISAHGTATIYNDEMEAKAITFAGMDNKPVNSLKAYYGHTLGAAGIIESIVTMYSLTENLILPTAGFTNLGVTPKINICKSLIHQQLNYALKTASGFGGCNAAVVFGKTN